MTILDLPGAPSGLKPEIKKRWTEALRSGDYRQTQGVLRRYGGPTYSEFCCLGVLCDLVDSSHWAPESSTLGITHYGDSFDFPPFEILDAAGITNSQARQLAEMNDGGANFETIAQAIEDEAI